MLQLSPTIVLRCIQLFVHIYHGLVVHMKTTAQQHCDDHASLADEMLLEWTYWASTPIGHGGRLTGLHFRAAISPLSLAKWPRQAMFSRADVNWLSMGVGERAPILPQKAIRVWYPVPQTHPFLASGFRRLRCNIIEHAWVWPVLGKSGPSQRNPYF